MSPFTDAYGSDYPFSVKPENGKVSKEQLIQLLRDHYEGTQFDLTKGLAAGPYGDPNRFDQNPTGNMTYLQIISGGFERAISLFRTSTSFVAIARKTIPDNFALLWYAQYSPSISTYTPLYVIIDKVPPEFSRGSLNKFDSEANWWYVAAVGNWAARFYCYAKEDINELQKKLQCDYGDAVIALEKKILGFNNPHIDELKELFTQFSNAKATSTYNAYKSLWFSFISKYHDGYIAENVNLPTINMAKIFYPEWFSSTLLKNHIF